MSHWDDSCTPLRHFSLVQANPPGGTHRRTVQVSWREWNLKFHNNPTPLSETRTVGHLLPPVNTRYPLMLRLGELLPQLTPANTQCESNVSCSKTLNGINLEPFDCQANALATWLCSLAQTQLHTVTTTHLPLTGFSGLEEQDYKLEKAILDLAV